MNNKTNTRDAVRECWGGFGGSWSEVGGTVACFVFVEAYFRFFYESSNIMTYKLKTNGSDYLKIKDVHF